MTETMKKWMSLLLCLLMVLGLGTAALAAEENPVGVVTGNLYGNDALGICVELPDNWRFLSDADLAAHMGYDSQYASREGLAALLEKESAVCGMFAVATNDPAWTANLMIQDLGIYRYLDEKTYLSYAKGDLAGALEPQGYTDVQVTETTFQMAGQEHAGAVLTAKLGTLEMYMIVVLAKGDRYIGSLTVASFSKEKTEEVLSYVKPLSEAGAPRVATQGQANAGAGAADPQAVADAANEAQYNQAKEAMNEKYFYTAYKLFSELGGYKDAAEQAKLCQRPMPKTKQRYRNPSFKQEAIRLNLTNSLASKANVFVRIYDITGNTLVSTSFIQNGKAVALYLPDDTFLFKMGVSRGPWYGDEETFGEEGSYFSLGYQTLSKIGRGYYYLVMKDEMDFDPISWEDF